MSLALAMMLTAAPQACAFSDERGTLSHGNPTPAFEAAGKPWYQKDEKIAYAGANYSKYGLPRQLAPAEVEGAADRGGVPLFIEAGNYSDAPDIIYVMVKSADCSFQPYARESR